jgi:hypothetical protein
VSITSATLEAAALRMHMDLLDSPSPAVRLRAGVEVCRLAGVLEAVRGLAADGSLRPPPEWPLVDVVPDRCEVIGTRRLLVVLVRTQMGGQLRVDFRLDVPLRDGALMDCVEQGKAALRRRIERMVVG